VWTGEGTQFEGEDSWGNHLRIGGDEGGPGAKPADLLPLSIAACTAYDVVVILRKQRQDLRALEVGIRVEQDPEAPWTFHRIELSFVASGDVVQAKAERALALAEKNCSVEATVRDCVTIECAIEVVPE
jgi:putative redox protein